MSSQPTSPWVLRLPLALVQRCRSISAVVQAQLGGRGSVPAFEFKSDERPFALALLRSKTNLWAYRSNQRRFCGDFVVVDMSTRPARRVWVIDLKRSQHTLKIGGGGAGVQFVNADKAVASIARGLLDKEARVQKLCGNKESVLGYLSAR